MVLYIHICRCIKYRKTWVVLNVVATWLPPLENGTLITVHVKLSIQKCLWWRGERLFLQQPLWLHSGSHAFLWSKVKIPDKYCFSSNLILTTTVEKKRVTFKVSDLIKNKTQQFPRAKKCPLLNLDINKERNDLPKESKLGYRSPVANTKAWNFYHKCVTLWNLFSLMDSYSDHWLFLVLQKGYWKMLDASFLLSYDSI